MNKIFKNMLYKNYNVEDEFEYFDVSIQKNKPIICTEKRKQLVEKSHWLLSNWEYVNQSTIGISCDSFVGTIARKIRFINKWVVIKYEC
jgi:hypothetical protein